MRLPIDTSGISFIAAGPPEATVDFETKTAKVDESGQPIFGVADHRNSRFSITEIRVDQGSVMRLAPPPRGSLGWVGAMAVGEGFCERLVLA